MAFPCSSGGYSAVFLPNRDEREMKSFDTKDRSDEMLSGAGVKEGPGARGLYYCILPSSGKRNFTLCLERTPGPPSES